MNVLEFNTQKIQKIPKLLTLPKVLLNSNTINFLLSTINLSLETFFTAIGNGKWQNLDELSSQLTISNVKLNELSKFLSDQGLIKYEERNHRIQIQPKWAHLLPEKEETKIPKPTIGNFLIPPRTSINIHSTHISNMSNVEVEVTLRIDTKIREIAIDL